MTSAGSETCSHCPDGHDRPLGKPWGVYVSPTRDGDGQPITLHVAPSNGSHVAESDAEWLRGLIRGERASASEIIGEILAPLNGRLAAAETEGLDAHLRAKSAEAKLARFRTFLDEDFRQWCSPDGIAATYATRLLEILDREETP